jgi:hypothetical protein
MGIENRTSGNLSWPLSGKDNRLRFWTSGKPGIKLPRLAFKTTGSSTSAEASIDRYLENTNQDHSVCQQMKDNVKISESHSATPIMPNSIFFRH